MAHFRLGRIALPTSFLLLAACSSHGSEPVAPTSAAASQPASAAEPSAPEDTDVESAPMKMADDDALPSAETMLARAKADLASRTSAAEAEIEVVDAGSVTWPNSALGCPEEGAFYAQMLTEGYRAILRVGETTYVYHSGSDAMPKLCANPQKPLPGGPAIQ